MKYTNRWRGISTFQVPSYLLGSELSDSALSVFLVIILSHRYRLARVNGIDATVTVGHDRLSQRTGLHRNTVNSALRELKRAGYLQAVPHRKKHGEFGATEYVICNPALQQPMLESKSLMWKNNQSYFLVPRCFVMESDERWSLAKLSGTEVRLYLTFLLFASYRKNNEFETSCPELRKRSTLAAVTFKQAMERLEEAGLVWLLPDIKTTRIRVEICDPYTGISLPEWSEDEESNPANYFFAGDKGQAKRARFNTDNPELVERLVRESLPDNSPVIRQQNNGDLRICCPFHEDHNPSCSVSLKKNGCFRCFGCREEGSLMKLLAGLKHISQGEAIRLRALAVGQCVEFRDPDTNAEAIYSYRDIAGKLIKQVIRYPNPDGSKRFAQRMPGTLLGIIRRFFGVTFSRHLRNVKSQRSPAKTCRPFLQVKRQNMHVTRFEECACQWGEF